MSDRLDEIRNRTPSDALRVMVDPQFFEDIDWLITEVERLRSMEDATQAGFNEMLADLGKARAIIRKLQEEP